MDLFDQAAEKDAAQRAPLAERMRPRSLLEFVGQEHLTSEGKILARSIVNDAIPSLIFWGPPGTGKTTLARVIAASTGAHFTQVSAVLAGVKELREIMGEAEDRWKLHRKRTLLFVDEIHRFNKAQQDALLPHVEKGTVTLLGATTENPSFEVNAALLSRMRVVTLRGLEEDELKTVIRRALEDPRGLNGKVTIEDAALTFLAQMAAGDARRAITSLEVAAQLGGAHVDKKTAEEAVQQRTLLYDQAGEEHYNVVSAFIKSMRGSDPDASVYWMARMLEAGEDVRFVLRRMVIFASEDVGNADPRALQVAVSALHAVELIGLPEGIFAMTQAVTYLAMAPKANTALTTYSRVREAVMKQGPLPVPMHLRNAPTKLMKSLGYGSGYQYPHDFEGHVVPGETYLPEGLRKERFYLPSQSGEEKVLAQRLEGFRRARPPKEPGEDG